MTRNLETILRVAGLLVLSLHAPISRADEQDYLGRKIVWKTPDGAFAAPIHMTLLPNGRLLFNGFQHATEVPLTSDIGQAIDFEMPVTPVGQPEPPEVLAAPMNVPLDFVRKTVSNELYISDMTFCSGHTLMEDGRVFFAGGTRQYANFVKNEYHVTGLDYAMTYDPGASSWSRVAANMKGMGGLGDSLKTAARWYPSVTRLSDSRLLVTSGYDYVLPVTQSKNRSVEVYDPALGTWDVISPHATTPDAIWSPNYTHAFNLPYPASDLFGLSVLMVGVSGQPAFMTMQGQWYVHPTFRPDTQTGQYPANGVSTLMLPIRANNGDLGYLNGSLALVGGQEGTSHERSVDIFDPLQGSWRRVDIEVGRHHPTSLLLPDGKLLVLGGCSCFGDADPRIGRAQYIDPKENFKVTWGTASMSEFRGYHTLATLLPDGRVLIGGGNPEVAAGFEEANFRYYYPPYFWANRPGIAYAPTSLKLGQSFFMLWSGAKLVNDVVLIGLGSMTHSVDMNQRFVQLKMNGSVQYSPTQGYLSASVPANAEALSPGYYMLFALDQDRIPSEAKIVKVER